MDTKRFPGYSPSIFPSQSDLHGMKHEINQYEGCRVDVLSTETPNSKHMIYLHGGGYYCGYGLRHWKMVSYIGSESNTTIHCLDYPLIPHTSKQTINFVKSYFLSLIKTINPDEVYFIGDSAGAGLAIATIMTLRDEGLPLPQYNFMLAPYVDVTFSHPLIPTNNPHDETLYKVGKIYAGDLDMKNYQISPRYGDMNDLCPTLVVTNKGDRLHYDVLEMVKKLKESNTSFDLMLYEGLYHDFNLDLYLEESEEVHRKIISILK